MPAVRLSPVEEHEIPEQTLDALRPYRDKEGNVYGIWRTLAHHPDALRRFLVFGNHVLGKNSLPPRTRELVILRIAWLTRAEYEWSQHVRIARNAGVTQDEIAAVRDEDSFGRLEPIDRLAVVAAAQLVQSASLDEATWSQARELLTDKQLIDLVYTVGQYLTIAMVINVFGVALETGAEPFPEPAPDGSFR